MVENNETWTGLVKHGKPARKRILIMLFTRALKCQMMSVMWISRIQTKKLLVSLYGFDIHQHRLA